jgi:PAB1-binding protein PBP1
LHKLPSLFYIAFKTDADITGKLEIKERELHKWAPTDEDNALGLLDGDLESSGGTTWDQFAVNEKLFGLKTDFDEEIYTTPLNRSAPGFKDREKKAIQVANEIQKVSKHMTSHEKVDLTSMTVYSDQCAHIGRTRYFN